ncbi:SCO family protein [Sorangium sp. So ce1014]|uniref:SCO family protein n=1 Tax=Sorangium sp. So ce1014 TaxID=3133326 RepID=UPI003F5DCA06
MRRAAPLFAAALALALPCASPAAEPVPDRPPARIGGSPAGDDAAAAAYFTDTELIDQDGRARRFYTDLLRGRKVLIHFAFTSCKGACPTMAANLARVQSLLGKRAGKEIAILTITVDPVNDTPKVLKRFAAKFSAGDGWRFLTGTPDSVEKVLGRLGGLTKKPDEHTSTLLIGDVTTGMWLKTVATERPETIVQLVDHINDKP